MLYGLSGAPIPENLMPYAAAINAACADPTHNVAPCLAGAIALRETVLLGMAGVWDAATIVSGDGGHGCFQLTLFVPDGWADPATNANAACRGWLQPDLTYFHQRFGLTGDALAKAVACSFNSGRGNVTVALLRHGDPDKDGNFPTTSGERGPYGADVVNLMHQLLAGVRPH